MFILMHFYFGCLKDFDPFNCGKVTISQFHRGIDALGISGLRRLYLSLPEIESIVIRYRDPVDPARVYWRTFEDDIEQVFTTKVRHLLVLFYFLTIIFFYLDKNYFLFGFLI